MNDLRKILHVEDDPDIREIAFLALAELGGFELLQCASGTEALARAEAFQPDLMVLDVMMPKMSGIEALAAMREIPALANTPAIFMTSKDVSSKDETQIAAQAIGVIQKPFDPVALPDRLRRMMDVQEST